MAELFSIGLTLVLVMAFLSLFRTRDNLPAGPFQVDSLRHASRHMTGFRIDPASPDTLFGEIDGVGVRFRLALRGRGVEAVRWTEVEVDVPRGRLSLHLRPRSGRPGTGANVVGLDDATFDQMFVLEAAPADVARRLLTATDDEGRSLASRLVGLGPVWIVPIETGFRIAVIGWQDRPARVDDLTLIASMLGARLGEAFRAADRSAAVAGSPYRPEVDAATLARLEAERTESLRRLGASERRELARLWIAFGVALACVVALPVLLAI